MVRSKSLGDALGVSTATGGSDPGCHAQTSDATAEQIQLSMASYAPEQESLTGSNSIASTLCAAGASRRRQQRQAGKRILLHSGPGAAVVARPQYAADTEDDM